MKTALVCGAGGFIGSHLVKRLKKEGFKNYYYPFYSIIHLDGAIAKREPVSRELQLLKSKILYFKARKYISCSIY